MKDIKCIIFDCDGVLVDSEQVTNAILLEMARAHGCRITLEQAYREFRGRSLQQCMDMIEVSVGKKLPVDFVPRFRENTYSYYRTKLRPIEGVRDFIDALTIDYCVASSGPLEKMDITLTATGLIENFRARIFSSYQINSWKPEPDIFLFAARQMGYSTNECLVIEDSIAGVIAAVKGGFKVYGYAAAGNAQELINEGAEVFFNFKELQKKL